ncbi:hypothetical protein GF420_14040 [candidate division GN15 bacterium]|nr:hypothetical protein [candidate division GN15 bacterium]
MRECGVASDTEGRCPVCGMHLQKLERPEQDTAQAGTEPASDTSLSGVYTCPMPSHFDVVQYGEGDCPECGMALVPVEETENDSLWVCPMRSCGVAQAEAGDCPVCGMHLKPLEEVHGRDR